MNNKSSMGWIITAIIATVGWVFMLGWNFRSIQANTEKLSDKADKQYVEQSVRRIDEKLTIIIEWLKRIERQKQGSVDMDMGKDKRG